MMHRFRRKFCRARLPLPLCAILLVELAFPAGTTFARPAGRALSPEELFRGLILLDGPASDLIPEIRDQLRPVLDRRNRRLGRAVAIFQDQLIDALKARDPELLVRFAESIRSGDHLRIQEALLEAARATAEVIRQNPVARALGRAIREDPRQRQAFLDALREAPGAQQLSEEDLARAFETLAWLSVDDSTSGPNPYTIDTSIVAVLVSVAAIVVAVTVALAQSYAAVLNIAGAVNFFIAIIATTTVTITNKAMIEMTTPTLLQEQMVDSIAVAFRR